MIYGSVCSGIEAATRAWHPLGWTPAFFSEIEAFPSAVLAHHYGSNMPGQPLAKNGIPNHGDFTTIGESAGPIDLLVGGTPCQSFSVAGKRLGLDDPRGNLALEYLALARRLGARWFVWENVPGVLSSVSDEEDGEGGIQPELEGREPGDEWIEESDFATFLEFVLECGYGFAYRVLDAQFVRVDGFPRAVPQRRRRVFVVGYLGDWRPAAAVLLEPEGMRGDPAPRRQAGQRPAGTVDASAQRSRGAGIIPGVLIANPLRAQPNDPHDDSKGTYVPVAFGGGNCAGAIDVSTALTALTAHGQRIDFEVETFVAHSLRGEGFDASEDGTGRGMPIVPICFNSREDPDVSFDRSGPLGSSSPQAQAIAYALRNDAGRSGEAKNASLDAEGKARKRDAGFNVYEEHAPTLDAGAPHAVAYNMHKSGNGGSSLGVSEEHTDCLRAFDKSPFAVHQPGWAVRRLTPRECERLQGFPDDFTNVPWRGRETAPDGPRYKALGNSMAVNVMAWIGMRIDLMEGLIASGKVVPE